MAQFEKMFYTARSEYVLFLRWEGEQYKQIAARLGVSPVRARQIYERQLRYFKHKMQLLYGE